MPIDSRGGVNTYWTRYGSGGRAALLAHCTMAHSGAYKALAESLGDLLTITAFDLPGHGRSEAYRDTDDIQALTAGIIADFLTGPTDLIGHSFGATAALRLAMDRPDLVRSLVLIEPVFMSVAFADDPTARARHAREAAPYGRAKEAGDYMAAARAFSTEWGNLRAWEDLGDSTKERMAEQVKFVIDGEPVLYDDVHGFLSNGAFQAITAPTLILTGAETHWLASAVAAGLVGRMPNARRADIAGAGHMAPITHPEPVAQAIRAFLVENDAAQRPV